MDIEKLKAEFEQSECFKKLEHVAQYTFFEFGAYLKRTDVPDNVEKKCGHLITALIFSWGAWKEAKAKAVPEWISVEDSLPEFGVPVLAKNMKFQEGKFWWIFERCDSDDGWVWSRFESSLNEAYCDDYEITHWMPLPAVLKVPEQK